MELASAILARGSRGSIRISRRSPSEAQKLPLLSIDLWYHICRIGVCEWSVHVGLQGPVDGRL
jgi:hypothetical protein